MLHVTNTNCDFLHRAQVEVFGTFGINKSVGRTGFVVAGKHVTAAVVRPLPDPRDIERAFKRAVLLRRRGGAALSGPRG